MKLIGMAVFVGLLSLHAAQAVATPLVFGGATATFSETILGGWPVSDMINGNYSPSNGWAILTEDPGDESHSETALLTLATPLAAGSYDITFDIYQYYGQLFGSNATLGDFELGFTTASTPSLTSSETPFAITGASSANGTTFTSQQPGQLLAGGPLPENDIYHITVSVSSAAPITGIFLNAIDDPNNGLPTGGPGRVGDTGAFIITQFTGSDVYLGPPPSIEVPEPTSIALFSTGLIGLALLRRRTRIRSRNTK